MENVSNLSTGPTSSLSEEDVVNDRCRETTKTASRRTHNPLVAGSSPAGPTNLTSTFASSW